MSNESMEYVELGSIKYDKKNPKKNRDINKEWIGKGAFIIGIVVITMLIIGGIVKLVGGGSYESAVEIFVENLFAGSFNGKVNESKLKKQYPQFMEESIAELCDKTKKEYEEIYETYFKDYTEYGEDFLKVTYEVVDKEKIDKKKLEEYQDAICEIVGDDEKVKVQGGYHVNVEIKIELKNKIKSRIEEEMGEKIEDDLFEENCELVVLKCNGKTGVWKIDDVYMWDL